MFAIRRVAILLLFASYSLAQANKMPDTAREYYDELRTLHDSLSPFVTQVCFFENSPDRFEVLGFGNEFTATAKAKGIKLDVNTRRISGGDFLLVQTYYKGLKILESVLEHDRNDAHSWYEQLRSKTATFRLRVTISPSGRYRRVVQVNDKIPNGEDRHGKCDTIK